MLDTLKRIDLSLFLFIEKISHKMQLRFGIDNFGIARLLALTFCLPFEISFIGIASGIFFCIVVLNTIRDYRESYLRNGHGKN